MKIGVVCSAGIGDALILHIVSHHLVQAGFDVTTITPHRFGRWLSDYQFGDDFHGFDALFLQHDNSPRAMAIQELGIPVYTFYGSHQPSRHKPLQKGFDYVCNPDRTMVDNVVLALQTLFPISATGQNGLKPPAGLVHRRFKKRVVIHAGSSNEKKNWQIQKFQACAKWLSQQGYEPVFLPQFATLEALLSFIYESGFLLGNDSGPGHIASYFKIPHLIIGPDEKQMRLWRPGWGPGEVVVPPRWIPNWKGWRLRENYWKTFINPKKVINTLKERVLSK